MFLLDNCYTINTEKANIFTGSNFYGVNIYYNPQNS